MKQLPTVLVILWVLVSGCSPLPRPGVFQGAIGVLPVSSEASGLVLTSSDSSYSSSDIYYYNFSTGQLSLLANGESGDALVKWMGQRLWLFNRSNGRVSYSYFSPKVGSASRSTERRTPNGLAGDPSDMVYLSSTEVALGFGSAHKVIITNLLSGIASSIDLGRVDTGESSVPFRPGVLVPMGNDFWVFHQHLNEDWKAAGGGRIFISRRSSTGNWTWIDQNLVVPDTQGVLLNISNPVSVFKCEANSCLIGGACYASMGSSCVAGIDEFDSTLKSVRHVSDLPNGYESAGQMKVGLTHGSFTTCVRSRLKENAEIVSITITDGTIEKSWDAGASYCGSFQVDSSANRIFAVKAKNSVSELHVLNSDLTTVAVINLPFVVTGLEMVDE